MVGTGVINDVEVSTEKTEAPPKPKIFDALSANS